MEGYYGTGCKLVTAAPTSADIAKTNQNCTNRSTCDTQAALSPVGAPQDGSCPRVTSCPNEGRAYLLEGPNDPCENPDTNGCGSLADAQFSGCCYETQSPIIIDLLGLGFQLTDAADGVNFDFSGNGTPNLVSWLAPGGANAWLALDRDGDGKINSGKELFGNYTPQRPSANPNGFAALAEFDKSSNGGNGDGIINSKDAVFAKLRLWTDYNHNGISEPGELHSLQQFGIVAIDLAYQLGTWQDVYGNVFRFKGRVLRNQIWEDRTTYDVLLVGGAK